MKRFILFAGDDYYPYGGSDDVEGFYDTIEEAIENHIPRFRYDGGWANILDCEKHTTVRRFKGGIWFDNIND